MKAFEQVLKYNLRLTGRQIYSDPSPSCHLDLYTKYFSYSQTSLTRIPHSSLNISWFLAPPQLEYPDPLLIRISNIMVPRLSGSLIYPDLEYPDSSLIRSSNIRISCLSGSRISRSLAYPDLEYPGPSPIQKFFRSNECVRNEVWLIF